MKIPNIPNTDDFYFPNEWLTITDLIHARGAEFPEKRAIRYYSEDGSVESLTNGELLKSVKNVAYGLARQGKVGDRVLIILPPSAEYTIAILGALYAGLVPIPSFPPQSQQAADTLSAIIGNANPSLIILDEGLKKKLLPGRIAASLPFSRTLLKTPFQPDYLDFCFLAKNLVTVESLQATAAPEDLLPFPRHYDDIAYLFYTPGATAAPKGVKVTHRNMINNLSQWAQALRFSRESEVLLWVPPFTDMGLLGGILAPLFLNIVATSISPTRFMRDPLLWLELIGQSEGKVVSSSPNFGYEMCVQYYDEKRLEQLDLSNWYRALSGMEPLHEKTLESFIYTFEQHGFRGDAFFPSYGLAENTLFVSGSPYKRENTLPISRGALKEGRVAPPLLPYDTYNAVSCGTTGGPTKIEIVDPATKMALSDREIGEVWIQSQSIAQGYWENPLDSRRAFGNVLDPLEPPYLATGDYGFIADQKLYITGRIEEILSIGGKSIYPHDLEEIVEDLSPHIRKGGTIAFAFEEIVLVLETDCKERVELNRIAKEARKEVWNHFQALVDLVCFAEPHALSKTASGKMQRAANRRRFLEGTLPFFYSSEKGGKAETVQEIAAHTFGCAVEEIPLDKPIGKMGYDSLDLVHLVGALETRFRKRMDLSHIDYKITLADLTAILEHSPEKEEADEADPHAKVPMTHYQKELFQLNRARKTNGSLVVPLSLPIEGNERERVVQKLEKAFAEMPILHSTFHLEDQELYFSPVPGELPLVNEGTVEEFLGKPFDLEREYPIRVFIGEKAVVIALHHIIGDLQSFEILFSEAPQGDLSSYFHERKQKREGIPPFLAPPLPPRGATFPQKRKTGKKGIGSFDFSLGQELSSRMEERAKEYTTSPFNILLSAFYSEEVRRKGAGSVGIGIAVNPRRKTEWMNLIGAISEPKLCTIEVKENLEPSILVARIDEGVKALFDSPRTYAEDLHALKHYSPQFSPPDYVVSYAAHLLSAQHYQPLARTELDTPLFLTLYRAGEEFRVFAEYKKELIEEEELQKWLQSTLQEGEKETTPIRISASFSTNFLTSAFEQIIQNSPWNFQLKISEYGQMLQELHQPEEKGLHLVYVRPEDALHYHHDEKQVAKFLDELTMALRNQKGEIGVIFPKTRYGTLVEKVRSTLASSPQIQILTEEEIDSLYPVENKEDPHLLKSGHLPFTKEYSTALALVGMRVVASRFMKRPKVVAVDCDNTLWKGVAAEGPIELTRGHQKLQHILKRSADAGILVCLVSKNVEGDVVAAFQSDFPLGLGDVVARKINWESKVKNLEALAQELSLGLDTFLFLDDNPLECAEVAEALPEVLVLQVPTEGEKLEEFVEKLWLLDSWSLSETDKKRTALYRQEATRASHEEEYPSYAEFIRGLEVKTEIEEIGPHNLRRASQLTLRTNQFNTTTLRLKEEELRERKGFLVRGRDRFGDYGEIGLFLVEPQGEALNIPLFLLSCRVIGRGIEHEMIRAIGRYAEEQRCQKVFLPFTKTERNAPAEEFLRSIGHELSASEATSVPFEPKERPRAVVHTKTSSSLRGGHEESQRFPPFKSLQQTEVHTIAEKITGRVGLEWTDDLFTKGALSSLQLIELLAEVEKTHGVEIPLDTFLQNPTIQTIADLLENKTIEKKETDQHLQDAILPASIQPGPPKESEALCEAMVTGATGNIGAFLLRELLDHTQASIHCLVRAKDDREAKQRILDNLQKYDLLREGEDRRIFAYASDLAKPHFALGEALYQKLRARIEIFYHLAAEVNFIYPYERLREKSTGAMLEVLSFCSSNPSIPLHHISSTAIYDIPNPPLHSIFEEKEIDESHARKIVSGYSKTKWVTETLALRAKERGLPVTIYRPAGIGGADNRHVKLNESDVLVTFLLSCLEMEALPDINTHVNFVPVDYVARALFHLSQRGKNTVYNIANPRPIRLKEFAKMAQEMGRPLELLPYAAWAEKLKRYATKSAQPNLQILLRPLFVDPHPDGEGEPWLKVALMRGAIDTTNTSVDLPSESAPCPAFDARLILKTILISYMTAEEIANRTLPSHPVEKKPGKGIILYENTGFGHSKPAKILQRLLAPHPTELVALEDYSKLQTQSTIINNHLSQERVDLYAHFHSVVDEVVDQNNIAYQRHLQELAQKVFRDHQPDYILSLHSVGTSLAPYFKELAPDIPIVSYITDWKGHFLHGWANHSSDLFLCQSPESEEYLASLGVLREKIRTIGPILQSPSGATFPLTPGKPTLLLNNPPLYKAKQLIESLLRLSPPFNLVISCCKSVPLKEIAEIIEVPDRHNLLILYWTDHFPDLLQKADIFIGKPGSGTIQEVLQAQTVPILDTEKGPMPQEKDLVDYVVDKKLGDTFTTAADLTAKVSALLKGEALHEVKSRIQKEKIEDQSEKIVYTILDFIQQKERRAA